MTMKNWTFFAMAGMLAMALVLGGCPESGNGGPGFCGDGDHNTDDEDCDGADLDGKTCEALGYDSGTLTCQTNCDFDVSACEGQPCGNGALDFGEDCDGDQQRRPA